MILNLKKDSVVIWTKNRDFGPGVVYQAREVTATVEFQNPYRCYNCLIEDLIEPED